MIDYYLIFNKCNKLIVFQLFFIKSKQNIIFNFLIFFIFVILVKIYFSIFLFIIDNKF